jgi:putative ABC transport system ATP-binding protein
MQARFVQMEPANRQETLVELRGLSRSFREGDRIHVVLQNVDARIGRGELAVLLGKSGSGKSTLLNLVSGIDNPTSGDVLVDGLIVNRLSERERTLLRRHRIGFVFQFFNLLPTLTVWENLLLPIELQEKVTAPARGRARDLLDAVGLPDRASSYPDRLSGGERQRVAIARALMHSPDLLLADEPTGNLDVDTGLEVIELLDRLIRREGKTMIMATHSPEVVGVADRIFNIEHARLVEQTPTNPSSA